MMGSRLKLADFIRWRSLALCTALSLGMAHPAFGQSTVSPPRQDSESATGVSFRNGTLSLGETDLSIGGDFPNGLTLARTYNSAVTSRFGPGANWTFSVNGYVSIEALPIDPDSPPPPGQEAYVYNVVFGGKTVGFLGGTSYVPGQSTTGGPVGTYVPTVPSGASLVFSGTPTGGTYTFTDADGAVVNFTPAGPNGKISNWTMPDGTRLDYTYGTGSTIRSIISNRGWALLFEAGKACAVNMATTYITATSTCPSGAQTVTYGTTAGSYVPLRNLLTTVTKAGATTNYTYNNKDHLNCVKDPGQSVCRLQTTYTECAEDPNLVSQVELHLHDYVTGQQDASGKTYSYSYDNGSYLPVNCPKFQLDPNPDYRAAQIVTTTMVENATATTSLIVDPGGLPGSITDPIGRVTVLDLTGGGNVATYGFLYDSLVSGKVYPEGTHESYAMDARGNFTSRTMAAKPASGLPNIVTSATYPSVCSNAKTCNKPTAYTDGRGNTTDYTYDATHGGLLTETAPADANGVRAVKRFGYVQRSAWIRNSGGTYSQVGSSIWLLSTEKSCRTSATVAGACAAGATDEVVTTYDYGPDSGPNNLLLRGKVVAADGVSLRTCYAYDGEGNKISETSPRGTTALTACP